jgi:hypothetical protein
MQMKPLSTQHDKSRDLTKHKQRFVPPDKQSIPLESCRLVESAILASYLSVRTSVTAVPMDLSIESRKLLGLLKEYSGNKLLREKDTGMLLHLAQRGEVVDQFERVAFLAKFASRANRIMQRIGKKGEGYEKLEREFALAIEEITSLLRAIVTSAPPDEAERFRTVYLERTIAGLRNLLELLSDLSWYKSWRTDHRGKDPWRVP